MFLWWMKKRESNMEWISGRKVTTLPRFEPALRKFTLRSRFKLGTMPRDNQRLISLDVEFQN
jgi:hypothetical protein